MHACNHIRTQPSHAWTRSYGWSHKAASVADYTIKIHQIHKNSPIFFFLKRDGLEAVCGHAELGVQRTECTHSVPSVPSC
jgi:hypothetical protein